MLPRRTVNARARCYGAAVVRSAKVTVWFMALGVVACTAAPRPVDAGADAPDVTEYSPCVPPCGPGMVCLSFRCQRAIVTTPDGGAAVDARAADAVTVRCCPLDPPSCGCVRVGGTAPASGVCPTVCGEGYPEDWVQRLDANNCRVWRTSGTACFDAGPNDVEAAVDP